MAQFLGAFWWQASLQRQLSCQISHSKVYKHSSISVPPFFSRTIWEDLMVPRLLPEIASLENPKLFVTCPSIVCFRDDNAPFPEYLVDKDWNNMSMGASLEIRYSPWAVQMMHGFGNKDVSRLKESTGGHLGLNNNSIDILAFSILAVKLLVLGVAIWGAQSRAQGVGCWTLPPLSVEPLTVHPT
jgi:hypothetical protein